MASIENGEFVPMSTASTDVATARDFVVRLENAEAKRLGKAIADIRPNIAARLKSSPGTLENIRRDRTKIIPSWLMDRLRAQFVVLLQQEIQGLEHEIYLARQAGSGHCCDALASAETQLAAARKILEEGVD